MALTFNKLVVRSLVSYEGGAKLYHACIYAQDAFGTILASFDAPKTPHKQEAAALIEWEAVLEAFQLAGLSDGRKEKKFEL